MQVKNSSDFIFGIPLLCVVPVWKADVSKQGKTQVDEHFIFDTLKIWISFFLATIMLMDGMMNVCRVHLHPTKIDVFVFGVPASAVSSLQTGERGDRVCRSPSGAASVWTGSAALFSSPANTASAWAASVNTGGSTGSASAPSAGPISPPCRS